MSVYAQHPRRGRIVATAFSVAAGLILSVVSAWILALFSESISRIQRSNFTTPPLAWFQHEDELTGWYQGPNDAHYWWILGSLQKSRSIGVRVAFYQAHEGDPPPHLDEVESTPPDWSVAKRPGLAPTQRPFWPPDAQRARTGGAYAYLESAAGFPALCLSGYREIHPIAGSPIDHIWSLPSPLRSDYSIFVNTNRMIPFRPIPRGVLVNTVFWAAIVYTVLFGYTRFISEPRIRIRLQQGRCVRKKCGYPLEGRDVCPECGAKAPAGSGPGCVPPTGTWTPGC